MCLASMWRFEARHPSRHNTCNNIAIYPVSVLDWVSKRRLLSVDADALNWWMRRRANKINFSIGLPNDNVREFAVRCKKTAKKPILHTKSYDYYLSASALRHHSDSQHIYNAFKIKLSITAHCASHKCKISRAYVESVRYSIQFAKNKNASKSENNWYWRTTWMLPMINESQHFTWTNWANWFELETFPI